MKNDASDNDSSSSIAYDPVAADHIFIIDPGAFQRKADMDAMLAGIDGIFHDYDGLNRHVHVSRYPRDAIGAINRYVRDNPGNRRIRVYAVGGDGILFDCLNAVMGLSGAELAIVPCGHVNEFIRAFGEGREEDFLDIRAQIVSASVPTDVIFCDGNYALNYCTIGLESLSIIRRAELIRHSWRMLNIFKALNKSVDRFSLVLSALSSRYSQNYAIAAGDEKLDGPYTTIHIANGPCYGYTLTPTGDSIPDDGKLELVIGYARSSLARAKLLRAMGHGKYLHRRYKGKINIQHRSISELQISSESPMIINLDGEIFYDSSMNVKVIHEGARVVAPNGASYSKRI